MIVFQSLPTFPVWVPQTMQLAPRVSTQRITSRITLLPVFWWALARNVPSWLFRPEESAWFLCVPVCPCSIYVHQSYVTVFPRLYCTNVASARPSDFRRWSCCLMVFLSRTPQGWISFESDMPSKIVVKVKSPLIVGWIMPTQHVCYLNHHLCSQFV